MRQLLLYLFLFSACLLTAQTLDVFVYDEDGQPVIGATGELVLQTDPNTSIADLAVSDSKGKLSLKPTSREAAQLKIRYVGYQALVMKIADPTNGKSLQLSLKPDIAMLDEVRIVAVRAKKNEPFAFTNIKGADLAEANVAQDIPSLLRRTPGAVFTSDAGNGVGYSGIRIRGADATRINVTVNGVPLNDSESQGVFWVNMPDFISSTSSIQIQRGVGQSTYGTGAFGANINLITDVPAQQPLLVGELAGGSFNTGRAMLKASTGELGNGFSAEGRLSYITSDGFVDRASSKLGSAYLGTNWAISDKQRLQVIGWTGKERTYQSWYGIPRSYLNDETLRTYNPAGFIREGEFYDDQVDNYQQSHAQLLYSHQLKDLLLQFTGHYTRGLGYYEEYRVGENPCEYVNCGGTEPSNPLDLVRRLWLDNHFYGGIVTLSGDLTSKFAFTWSGGVNNYQGAHYGTLVRFANPGDFPISAGDGSQRFYDNDATKLSANTFAKVNFNPTDRLSLYGDMQVRAVNYSFVGIDRSGAPAPADDNLIFVNPKAGVNLQLENAGSLFASAAIGQREPNRNDYTESPTGDRPTSEQLLDIELGYRLPQTSSRPYTIEANAYFMDYRDQLVPTGRLNDVGEYVRTNVDRSYRLGLELSAGYAFSQAFNVQGNVALSRSRIRAFDEYLDDWSTGEQQVLPKGDTPIGFSPNVISNVGLSYSPVLPKGALEISLWGNTVSKQYLDNSASAEAQLDGYSRVDLETKYSITRKSGYQTIFTFQLQNLLNTHPATNGYSYRFVSPGYDPRPDDPYVSSEGGDQYVLTGYYPQAGIQVLAGVRIELPLKPVR